MEIITPAEYKALLTKKTSRNLFSVINSSVQGWEMEYRFDEKRRFRFDFALPNLKIAVEYEGIFSQKSRHTSVIGYSKDVEKYNLATIQGWSILRYTAKNYKDAANDVLKLIALKTNYLPIEEDAKVIVAKNRNGSTGAITMHFKPNTTQFICPSTDRPSVLTQSNEF